MDLNKKAKITTSKQFAKMVELLEQNPSVARGYSSGIKKIKMKDEWNKIGDQLNILGPPTRTGEGWLKDWADYKFKIKKKLVHNKAECHATGGGTFSQYMLSPTEEAASNLLQLKTIVNPGGRAFGIQNNRQVENDLNDCDISMNMSQENETQRDQACTMDLTKKPPTIKLSQNSDLFDGPSSSNLAKKIKSTKNDLLEQLKVQTALYTELKVSLSEIERYQRKNYKQNEEQLKQLYKQGIKCKKETITLYKEELKNKKEFRKELLKIRKEEIEIEKRRIALDEIRNNNFLA